MGKRLHIPWKEGGNCRTGGFMKSAALTTSGANDRGKSFKPYPSTEPSFISSGSE